MARTQIPAKYLDDAGNDFADPLSNLLIKVGLLGQDNKDQADGLNELKEGALSLSKWLGGLAAAAGVAGILTSITGAITAAHEPTRVALVAGGALVGAAGIIAVALVVRGDVAARSSSAMAQYEARSQISSAFLALSGVLTRSASSTGLPATTNGDAATPAQPRTEENEVSGRAFGVRFAPDEVEFVYKGQKYTFAELRRLEET
jgi:hypothetical protein